MAPSRLDRRHALGVLVPGLPEPAGSLVHEELGALERHGFAVRLYALGAPGERVAPATGARAQAPLVQVPASLRGHGGEFAARHARLLAASPRRYLGALACAMGRGVRGLHDFARAGWLAGQLEADGVEHLHAHLISTPADIAELASRASGRAFSISAHAGDIHRSHRADLRRKLRAARFTVAGTDCDRATLAAIAPEAEVHRMHPGIDAARVPARTTVPARGVPLVLCIGPLVARSGMDTLVDACALLRERGRDIACEIVGDGAERARLQARIERRRLGECVRLVGPLAHDERLQRHARAAVYAQPARIAPDGDRDGIPPALLEAMAAGLPVAATRVSGIPELVVDGRNGLLVEPEDPAALADAIAHLLDHPRLRDRLGGGARRTVAEGFDRDRNLHLLAALLERERARTHPAPTVEPAPRRVVRRRAGNALEGE